MVGQRRVASLCAIVVAALGHVTTISRMRLVSVIVPSVLLCSCSTFSIVHDPQTGPINKEQVQNIVRATKCELITFFDTNRRRGKYYFDLSDNLYGNVIFDLTVVDTAGFPPAGTSIDRINTPNANPLGSVTWHFGPTLNGQNTYDMTLSYIVPQGAKLSSATGAGSEYACYSEIPEDLEGLADGRYPQLERFTRVRVNAVKPLASWLLEVATNMWPEMEAAKLGETAYPVQMAYAFTVQITGGLEVKYSLINPVWNPLAPDFAASSTQTGKLTFTLNGADAALASGANTGTAVVGTGVASPPPFVSPVPPRPQPRKGVVPAPQPPPGAGAVPAPSVSGSGRARKWLLERGQPHGHLLVPLPLVAPRGLR
jgi:hypothetical protein